MTAFESAGIQLKIFHIHAYLVSVRSKCRPSGSGLIMRTIRFQNVAEIIDKHIIKMHKIIEVS